MMVGFQQWALIPRSLGNKPLNITLRNHGTSTMLRVCIFMYCLLIVIKGYSQAPSLDAPSPKPPVQPTEIQDSVPSKIFLTPVDFYAPSQPIHDTLDYNHHRYDPADRATYPYATLGNLGSPARSLYHEMPKSKGLNPGHQAFDLYKVNFEDFRFYDTDIALSRLDYTQGLSQDDAMIRAAFGRNFEKGVNLSINYQRINQLGQYTRQRAKNTAFGIGVLYRSPKGKLDGIYHYLSNSIVHEDNGGVDNVEFWLDSIDLKRNVPIRLVDALTTHRTRQLTIQHHLHLFGSAIDSLARKADLDIIHTFKAGSWLVKFSDVELTEDEPGYYSEFVKDDRGMRNFLSNQILDNALDLQFRYRSKSPDVPSHLVRAGLQLRNSNLDQEPDKSKVQEMFLNASGRLGISSKISLDGHAYFGFLDANGEYRLDANARLRLFKDATTWAQLNLYQRKPSLIENRLFINQTQVWSTDFKNVSLSSVQFHYVHPSIRLRLHGGVHLVSNMIYFDASRLPQQLEQNVEILQMSVSKEFVFGPFGMYGHLMLQEYDVEQVALPHLILNGQLFYTGRWFKKALLVRAGVDVLVTDGYNGVSYFPGTGQFYVDDAFLIPQYPAIDIFFSMQVKDIFKAFIKLENATALVSEDHFIQIFDYPQFETYVRFGLWMKLFD